MANSRSTTGTSMRDSESTTSGRAPMRAKVDAVSLLKTDHRAVDALLKQYESAHDKEKESIAQQICAALKVHAQIEEEILYPAARDTLDEDDAELVREADIEHATIKEWVTKLAATSPDDEHYDAMVKAIGEYVRHHVKEEETELFPKLKSSDLDLKALGAELAARKAELSGDSEAS